MILTLLIALVAFPAFAQDEDTQDDAPTIADIVAGDEDFSILLQAVSVADPIVLETLSDPEASVTVFAPNNQAFENIADFFDTSLDALLADPALVTDLLLYHVVPGQITAEQVFALDGELVTPLLEEAAFRVEIENDTIIRLNGIVRVTAPFDVQASNGIIHTLADVIYPFTLEDQLAALGDGPGEIATPEPEATPEPMVEPISTDDLITVTGEEDYADAPQTEIETVSTFANELTIAGRVVSDARYSTLETILLAVAPDYVDLLNAPDGSFTLLAPTNSAFTNLLATLDLELEDVLENDVLLRQILAYHVIQGEFLAEDIIALDDERVDTILDNGDFRESILVTITGTNTVLLNEVVRVQSTDLGATNGVIHSVNNVLLPQVVLDELTELGLLEAEEDDE